MKIIIKLKKFVKLFLFKYFINIYSSFEYYLNLKKINKLKLYQFEIMNLSFSMFSTKNFIDPSWQKKETEVIINLLKNNDLFLNLGANIGYYVCLASKLKKKNYSG